jgi:hypothetical protein
VAINEVKVMHFNLEPIPPTPAVVDANPVAEFLIDLMGQLVDLLEFTYRGEVVKVDGFILRNYRTSTDKAYSLFPPVEDPSAKHRDG